MDVLASLFDEMYLSGEVVSRFDLSGRWGITMPSRGGIFHAVERGECWMRLDSSEELIHVSAGDMVLFPEGASHEILDAPESEAVSLEDALRGREPDTFRCEIGSLRGSQPDTTFICGVFHFRDGGFHAFRSMLPPVLHIKSNRGDSDNWLQTTMSRLCEEAASTSPGAHAVISRLTDILFIEGVRAWLRNAPEEDIGLKRAFNDEAVFGALKIIHNEPERPWTIASLAEEVSLSRSAFAARFMDGVGVPPLRYLTLWRMQLAKNWLHSGDTGLAEMSERLGYQSEDAFKRAFRREVGLAPGTYRKQAAEPKAAD